MTGGTTSRKSLDPFELQVRHKWTLGRANGRLRFVGHLIAFYRDHSRLILPLEIWPGGPFDMIGERLVSVASGVGAKVSDEWANRSSGVRSFGAVATYHLERK